MTETTSTRRPMIRAASILLENNRVCILKQDVSASRHWALPGGKPEIGETLAECVAREFREETGLSVRLKELLYITDRITTDPDTHIIHMLFRVERSHHDVLPEEWTHDDPYPSDSSDRIREVRMVPIGELEHYGFTTDWIRLIREDFPEHGGYKGNFFTFYGE